MEKLIKRKKSGFTLIEMIVVIAIVVIIAAIAIPQALKAVNKSKASTDVANARTYAGQIATGLANGDLTEGAAEADKVVVKGGTDKNDIKNYHIGGSTPAIPKLEGTKFTYTYNNDTVTIFANDKQVYPTAVAPWSDYIK